MAASSSFWSRAAEATIQRVTEQRQVDEVLAREAAARQREQPRYQVHTWTKRDKPCDVLFTSIKVAAFSWDVSRKTVKYGASIYVEYGRDDGGMSLVKLQKTALERFATLPVVVEYLGVMSRKEILRMIEILVTTVGCSSTEAHAHKVKLISSASGSSKLVFNPDA